MHSMNWPIVSFVLYSAFLSLCIIDYWMIRTIVVSQCITSRDQPKVVFPLTTVTESDTVSGQSVSAVTETTPKLIAYLRP